MCISRAHNGSSQELKFQQSLASGTPRYLLSRGSSTDPLPDMHEASRVYNAAARR